MAHFFEIIFLHHYMDVTKEPRDLREQEESSTYHAETEPSGNIFYPEEP